MQGDPRQVCWVDGRLVPRDRPTVRADDSAFSEGRGCYTSVRIQRGRARFAERHVRRLQRGARDLRLGCVEPAAVERALSELAEAAFPDGEGIIRLQISRDAGALLHLVGVPLGLEPDRPEWIAVTSPLPHSGELLPGGHKLTNRLVLALAAELAREAGADEALLFDAADRLVEGSRSNLVVVTREGTPATPPEELGAVAGIALQVVVERIPEVRRQPIARSDLRTAREIVALNAVRGARPITRLDGRPIADARPGPWATRLGEALADE
jgi:branched-subunit amino acid aminotransferase/4-amino-4-deoxychorismate lyase